MHMILKLSEKVFQGQTYLICQCLLNLADGKVENQAATKQVKSRIMIGI